MDHASNWNSGRSAEHIQSTTSFSAAEATTKQASTRETGAVRSTTAVRENRAMYPPQGTRPWQLASLSCALCWQTTWTDAPRLLHNYSVLRLGQFLIVVKRQNEVVFLEKGQERRRKEEWRRRHQVCCNTYFKLKYLYPSVYQLWCVKTKIATMLHLTLAYYFVLL